MVEFVAKMTWRPLGKTHICPADGRKKLGKEHGECLGSLGVSLGHLVYVASSGQDAWAGSWKWLLELLMIVCTR